MGIGLKLKLVGLLIAAIIFLPLPCSAGASDAVVVVFGYLKPQAQPPLIQQHADNIQWAMWFFAFA